MPIYEFICKSCGEQFEELVRTAGGGGKIACTYCGAEDVERLFSCFSVKSDGGGGIKGKSCGPCSKSSCSSCG